MSTHESPAEHRDADSARRTHYGQFYGLTPIETTEPLAIVLGNCQAESLRLMLDGGELGSVRIPPVHELVASDLPHLQRLLSRVAVLVAQPVKDGYHGMPLGTAEIVRQLGAAARVVLVPVIRFSGLYPLHGIVRVPSDSALDPPVVAYHDFRVLVEAAHRRGGSTAVTDAAILSNSVREIARLSLAELQRREADHETVVISDLYREPHFEQMRTINHPGNSVLESLADRVLDRLGIRRAPTDPGRPLLNGVHAPREDAVIAALGLNDAPREHWIVDGQHVSTERVRDEHLRFYEQHPDAIDAGLKRYQREIQLLGLA